jgi:hypothetical protein
MTLDKEDGFVQWIMATCDAAMAAAAASTTQTDTSEGTLVEREVNDSDFIRSCKGNLTDLRRILHLSLAKGNPKRML